MNRYLIALAVVLCGCNPNGTANLLQSIEIAKGQTPAVSTPINFTLGGLGICNMTFDWGDGSPADTRGVNFAINPVVSHIYDGWRGGKTITVQALSGCIGTARTRFTIEPAVMSLGWNQDPSRDTQRLRCIAAPGLPALAPMSLVHITSGIPPVVNFGCQFNGCIYDADGKLGSSAAPPFPFPGFREFSLVLRVGQQLFQGGKNAAPFTITNGGVLEFCRNTDDLTRNVTGGWDVDIRVDQLGN